MSRNGWKMGFLRVLFSKQIVGNSGNYKHQLNQLPSYWVWRRLAVLTCDHVEVFVNHSCLPNVWSPKWGKGDFGSLGFGWKKQASLFDFFFHNIPTCEYYGKDDQMFLNVDVIGQYKWHLSWWQNNQPPIADFAHSDPPMDWVLKSELEMWLIVAVVWVV